jgi:Protein of unknown function (DUF2782)
MRAVVSICLMSLALAVWAQNKPKDLEPLPEPPVVQEGLDDNTAAAPQRAPEKPPRDAQVTVVQRGDTTVEEYRVKGRLTMAKVTPKHGVPYYIHYRNGDDPLSTRGQRAEELRVPMWRIGNF